MLSQSTARLREQNSPTILTMYIAADRPYGIGYRTAYGIRLHTPEGILVGIGCVRGNQHVVALRQAIFVVLEAIEISSRCLKVRGISRTEFVWQTLDAGQARHTKKQYGMSVRPLKTPEGLYENTGALWAMHGAGRRMADPGNAREMAELSLIEGTLFKAALKDPRFFRSREEFHPTFDL